MEWKHIMLFFLMLSVVSSSEKLEIYSSTAVMSAVVKYLNKMEFISYLEDFVTSRRLWLTKLLNVIGQIETEECLVGRNNFSVEFPTDTFMFIRQQAYVSYGIQRFIRETRRTALCQTYLLEYRSMLPNETDVIGSITGLHRLEEVYHIKPFDMAQGNIKGNHTRSLTSAEMFTIANNSFAQKSNLNLIEYTTITKWTNFVNIQINGEVTSSIDEMEILDLKLRTFIRAGCFCSQEVDLIEKKQILTRKLKLLRRKRCKGKPVLRCHHLVRKPRRDNEKRFFGQLCRGEEVELPEHRRHLYQSPHELRCRLVDNNDPVLLLQPMKVEEVRNKVPIIAKLHDVLRENAIKFFKERASPNLQRGVLLKPDGTVATSSTKISQQSFLPISSYNNTIKNVRLRLAAATQLDIRGFEKIQVANYAGGGYYFVHADSNFVPSTALDEYIGKSNRIASMVMYMSDVEKGGDTVFPRVGATVQNEKGAVALFYNLYRNLTMNLMARHGGCPIALGEKWIATQWVTTYHQELTYPCTLNKTL